MADFDPRLLDIVQALFDVRSTREPNGILAVDRAELMEDVTVVIAALARQPVSEGMLQAASHQFLNTRPDVLPWIFTAMLTQALKEIGS